MYLAIDPTHYWTNGGDGTVKSMVLSTGRLVTIASGQNEPWGIAINATTLFWTNRAGNAVMRIVRE